MIAKMIHEKLGVDKGVILLRTTGDMGMEVILRFFEDNKEKISGEVLAFSAPQIVDRLKRHLTFGKCLMLGEDFEAHELFKITNAIRNLPEGSLVIFPLLNVLALHHPVERLQKLFLSISKIAMERNLIVLAVVDTRMFDERALSSFEELSTVVVEFVEEVENFKVTRGMRIKKSPRGPTGFYRVEVEDGKLHISDSPV